jgi:uncharacterized protein
MTTRPPTSVTSGARAAAPFAFHVMAKPRGAICDLECAYCFYLSKQRLYPGSAFRMSEETLERYVRQLIEAHRAPEVTFTWQGGEPTLMGLDFFRRAVELQARHCKPGMRIHNALQTNAAALDDEWCRFFRDNSFLLGVSLDGPRECHDSFRVDKGGAPTFDRVMAGITRLQRHGVEFNLLTCVHAANAGRGLDVYRFLRDEVGAVMIQLIPIVERDNATGYQEGEKVTPRSITGRQYGEFLIAVFDEWVRRDVGRVFVQLFDVALGVWFGVPSTLCVFAATCGGALALEHNGDVYSCDHFVEPGHLLGNITRTPLVSLVASPQQRAFGLGKRDALPRLCRECAVRFVCNGACPKDRILLTPDGEPGLNYLCEGLKAFFTHVDGPMRTMARLLHERRSPASIMAMPAVPPGRPNAGTTGF